MENSKNNTNDILDAFTNNRETLRSCSLDEFKQINRYIVTSKLLKNQESIVIFAEDRAMIRFLDKPKFTFLISDNNRFLCEKDLDVLVNPIFYGSYSGKYSFFEFLKSESKNWLTLSLVFLGSLILLAFCKEEQIIKVAEMLLICNSIFISIFFLFVFFTKEKIKEEFNLLKDDTLYRFFQNDKYILYLAIIAILCNLLTVVFPELVSKTFLAFPSLSDSKYLDRVLSSEIVLKIFSTQNPFQIIASGVMLSISLTILIDCYLAVIQYYFERGKTLIYRRLASQLFQGNMGKNMGDVVKKRKKSP